MQEHVTSKLYEVLSPINLPIPKNSLTSGSTGYKDVNQTKSRFHPPTPVPLPSPKPIFRLASTRLSTRRALTNRHAFLQAYKRTRVYQTSFLITCAGPSLFIAHRGYFSENPQSECTVIQIVRLEQKILKLVFSIDQKTISFVFVYSKSKLVETESVELVILEISMIYFVVSSSIIKACSAFNTST